jgi:uncharacterized protein (DUF2235 family)
MLSSNSCHDFSSSDEKILFDEMDQNVVMFFQCVFNFFNSKGLLNDHTNEGIHSSDGEIWDVLAIMWATPSLCKNFINFTMTKFEEPTYQSVLIISSHVRSTSEPF